MILLITLGVMWVLVGVIAVLPCLRSSRITREEEMQRGWGDGE